VESRPALVNRLISSAISWRCSPGIALYSEFDRLVIPNSEALDKILRCETAIDRSLGRACATLPFVCGLCPSLSATNATFIVGIGSGAELGTESQVCATRLHSDANRIPSGPGRPILS
jgi:hypothetical protein